MSPIHDRADQLDIYQRLGVRKIINGRGATTAVGGTLMPPPVIAAMSAAASAFVVIDELNQAVGRRIAAATGADAGYVTNGSAAAMVLAAAACIAGADPVRVRRMPETDGWANEIIIQRAHRIAYDQMFRVAGARLVEIGGDEAVAASSLERAITGKTAAIAYIDSPVVRAGALPFRVVVDLAHARDVPVIVDAASTLPPVDHLRRWIRDGADLVIYSGGKGIRGPQDSGILAGRVDLIEAARANGSPRAAIGRGMKVSKEALAGLAVALELFLSDDHEPERLRHLGQAERIASGLAAIHPVETTINADPEAFPAPVLYLRPIGAAWSPDALQERLIDGEPSIHLNLVAGCLVVNTHCLLAGDEEAIVHALRRLLPG